MTRSLLLTLAAALLAAPPARAGEPSAAAGAPARVRAVPAGAPGGAALVPASVIAAERATVSTRLAASVRAVHVREGQAVRAGDLLVSLSDDDVRGGLAAAQTGLAAAQAHERRIQALVAVRAATPAELELAQSQRAQAQAAVAGAQANLAYTGLRAPFAGVVQSRRVEPGDLVGPGQPLLLLEGKGLELTASLSADEARGVAVGQALTFHAGGLTGQAVVTSLTPGGDPLSYRRGLRASVKEPVGELRSGAFARLELPAAAGAAGVWVPQRALVQRGDLTGVFVAAGGKAELRWISPGEPAGDWVPIRAGVRPGETVIDAPGALRDGQPVEVQP
ncbi:MAG: efflux RND transporter periplasmic adaptor subunit [Anaeromyxobacter sp.]